jgi:hypothetical protein
LCHSTPYLTLTSNGNDPRPSTATTRKMSVPSSAMAMMQSAHRDVLEANPDSDESKVKLVEELQSRGRAAVGAKCWMDAKLIYEKALTVCVNDTNKRAILYSNLSLVEKSMGNFEAARKAADSSTQADPTYVKGWWRLGQALISLHRTKEALEALTKANVLDPNNKALIKEMEKVQKQADEEASLMHVEEDKKAAVTSTATSPKTITTTATTLKSTKATSSSSTSNKMDVDKNDKDDNDDDTNLFTKSEPVRGYKVVNGKKTSYFHNELDEKAKALIGDIAPKKLDDPAEVISSIATITNQGTSAWNQAGTWEEKDVSQWAKDTLTKAILQTTFTLPESSPAPHALVTVQKIKSLDGHASVAVVRGKTRFIYEYACRLEWQLEQNDSDLECKGSLAIPDIDGTIALGEGYEIHEFVIDSVNDNTIKPVIDRFVQRGGFYEALNESIDDWVRLFRKEYGPKDA